MAGWFPELVDAKVRSLTFGAINAHRERIRTMLATNTVSTVHQRLRDEHGLTVSIASFRRYVSVEFPERTAASKVTVLRPEVAPGEEAQIDYGFLGNWFDPIAERVRRVWAFVMVLACSRHMFVRPVLRMDQRAWVVAHVEAFAFFGGAPARLVPDNLKTGVDRPDLYDPKLNRAYGELAAMNDTFEDACVQGGEAHEPMLALPDDDDRHVVAAAVRGRADAIVTANIRDFPEDVLAPLGIVVVEPDDFLVDQLDLAPRIVLDALREQAAHTSYPQLTPTDLLAPREGRCAGVRGRSRAHGLTRPSNPLDCYGSRLIGLALGPARTEGEDPDPTGETAER